MNSIGNDDTDEFEVVEPSDRSSDETGEVEASAPPIEATLTSEAQERRSAHRSRWALNALVVALVAVLGVGVVLSRRETPPPPQPDIPLDAWVPYWTLDASTAVAPQRLGSMRDVSPFWFNAVGADEIVIDPNAADEDLDDFVDLARSSGVAVVPSIVDATPAGTMAAILLDPETRAQHVDAIMTFAEDGDYDGIDLDYEKFAFADGRDTWETTRPVWVAFVEDLAGRLHADGLTLTVSIPPVYDADRTSDSGFWVYDYGAIAEHVDRIRIMAYDFSVGEPGPIAPLEFVQRAIDGAVEATAAPEKLVLGVPVYGRNWSTGSTGDCTGAELEETTGVNARTVHDLLERRGGEPVFDEVTGEWSFTYDIAIDGTDCVQQRVVHYVDGDGVRLRMDLARESSLNGVSLWAFGFDDEGVWDEILPTVAADG